MKRVKVSLLFINNVQGEQMVQVISHDDLSKKELQDKKKKNNELFLKNSAAWLNSNKSYLVIGVNKETNSTTGSRQINFITFYTETRYYHQGSHVCLIITASDVAQIGNIPRCDKSATRQKKKADSYNSARCMEIDPSIDSERRGSGAMRIMST